MKNLLINSFRKMKQQIPSTLPSVWVFIVALLLSFGLGTAQAKDRISYFHSDISGSPIAATDAEGELLWEETYKPYGERLNTDNTNKTNNSQWFTGKQEEADLGLQYFGARWYHQESGRFISRDPAAVIDHVESNPMMFNRYAYANNNPYRYVDPDGRLPILIPIAIFIAKEIASEGVEQVTGLPMPTVKNGLKYAIKQANKQIAKEGVKQAAKIVKATSKSVANSGKNFAGKQSRNQRLKDLVNDDKVSSADRGWIKQEMNEVAAGKKGHLRNPPGKDLAHERGRENAKGYGYEHANLQNRKDHRLQHKLDNWGKNNKERPIQ